MNSLDYLKTHFENPTHAYLHLQMKSLLDTELTISEELLSQNNPYIQKVLNLQKNLKLIFNEYFSLESSKLKQFPNYNLEIELKNKIKEVLDITDLKDNKYVEYTFSFLSLEKDDLLDLYVFNHIFKVKNQWEDIDAWLENNEIKEITNEHHNPFHQDIIQKYALSFISTNNLFDGKSIQSFIEKAFDEIAHTLNLDNEHIGMNQIGLTFNTMTNNTAICTSEYMSAIKFDNLTTAHIAIGHEWIHAIDGLMAKEFKQKDVYFVSLLENTTNHPYPKIAQLLEKIEMPNLISAHNIDYFIDYLNYYENNFLKENIEKNLQAKNYLPSEKLEKGIDEILSRTPKLSLKQFQKKIDPYWNPLAPEGRKALIYTEFQMYDNLIKLKNLTKKQLLKTNMDINLYLTFAKKSDNHVYQVVPHLGENYVSEKLELLARSFEAFLDTHNTPSYATRISKTNFFVPQGVDRKNQNDAWIEFAQEIKNLHTNLNQKTKLDLLSKIKASRPSNEEKIKKFDNIQK